MPWYGASNEYHNIFFHEEKRKYQYFLAEKKNKAAYLEIYNNTMHSSRRTDNRGHFCTVLHQNNILWDLTRNVSQRSIPLSGFDTNILNTIFIL